MKDIEYYMSLKYPVNIEQEQDGSFFISYPDLEGCFSCADTLEGVLIMGEDARRAWTETAIENGIFIPEPRKTENFPDNYKIHMPRALYRQLAQNALKQGISMNQYCVYLLSKGCTEA